ncbi:MAG: rod shape-determining protein MreC [Candidatus Yanofskybacteria bacterium RIFCSPLOWO2_02_FULL_43_10b]|uniref:Cell shape-determining protein MreC n=1 Tax=Candidatus Yanofskybacteria bacterium RIFCSPLOWO2_02_FULL_43_10b TaxID=1802704 RepID=A0A1F8H520_9BACT|nr:MAG: rod shape-determining protein MreC [Candidatus Yanofskybacteria bacterium RIFCSPLOWO2_02_FULL_43_10b]
MSSPSNFLKKILISLAVVLFLVAFNNYWSNQWLKGSVLSFFKKPMGASYYFLNQAEQRVVSWFSTGNLLKENEALKSEKHALVSARLKISELEKENNFLRKELGVAKRKNLEVILAKIFSQQIDGRTHTVLIDVGADEEVKRDMPIVFDGEVILGVIQEVYANSSLVYLITDPRLNLSVKIPESEVMGRIKGSLTGGLSLELVANQEKVQPGQLVVTSGLDGLPDALIVGKIKTARTDRGGLFQKIEIEPEFKNLTSNKVFVLK